MILNGSESLGVRLSKALKIIAIKFFFDFLFTLEAWKVFVYGKE